MTAPTLKQDRNFRWLLRGAVISHLGDQLTLVALPLLVLQLTRDPLALGLVVACMGIPRAVFILFGGALVDRWSPQRVLVASKLANAVLLLTLVALLLTPGMGLTPVYLLAGALGLAQAFAIPAGSALVPAALPAALIGAANAVLMGLRQLSMLVGPMLAALLIGGSAGEGQRAMVLAFGIDAASFLVSAWTLSRLVLAQPTHAGPAPTVLGALIEGLALAWRDLALRLCFLYWAAMALLAGGAMQVALPLLAATRWDGAGTLGWLLAAQGAGTLLGMAAAALGARHLGLVRFGAMILLMDALAGLLVAPLGYVQQAWLAAVLLLAGAVLSGFLQMAIYSWIQRRVPLAMMGRMMSIFMFIFMGLAPLSAAAAGWLLTRLSLAQLFLGGGVALILLAAGASLFTPMRHIALAAPAQNPLAPRV